MVLILPLLLLLILGAMDFGRMFYTKMVITDAAREGVNYLSKNPDDKSNSYVNTKAVIVASGESSGITVTSGEITFTNCCTQGLPVSVTVTKAANFMFAKFLQIGGTPSLISTVTMVVQ